ncbi:hypothetical protein TNCV_5003421 [Trichonephila clavipes]|nr:hypothetical protein TNCV_5003421 [Trichonephila clavipes]
MPDHIIFQPLHRQLRNRFVLLTKHDAGQRRAVRISSLRESILNVVADRPKSSIKVADHDVLPVLLQYVSIAIRNYMRFHQDGALANFSSYGRIYSNVTFVA